MQIGLAIPGSGPVAGPAIARPAAVSFARRRWFDGRAMQASVQSWSRRHGLPWDQVACSLTLLACGILLGLFAGGYVGFIQAATPAADPPGSYAQLATSDLQWAAMARQDWLSSHPLESVGQGTRETRWQHLIGGAANPGAAGDSSRVLSSGAPGAHFFRLDTPGFRSVKKAVVAR